MAESSSYQENSDRAVFYEFYFKALSEQQRRPSALTQAKKKLFLSYCLNEGALGPYMLPPTLSPARSAAHELMREAVRQAVAEPAAPSVRQEGVSNEAYADVGYHTAGYAAVVLRGAGGELVAPMETGEMRQFGHRLIRTADSLEAGGGIPEE